MPTLPLETQEYITTVLEVSEEWGELELPCEMMFDFNHCGNSPEWLGVLKHHGCRDGKLSCTPCKQR